MKKLAVFFYVILITCLIGSPSFAKSKKQTSRSKSKFSRLQYEGVWFSRLTEKQQLVYLQTIERLTIQMSGGKVAFDDAFMKYLFPMADAAPRINNGYSFEGSNDGADFDAFLASQNVLGTPIDPGCTGNNQVCASTMGMVCANASDPGVLACSPDSTPTCVQRGDIACLHRSLRSCGMDEQGRGTVVSSDYCQALDRDYRRASEGVRQTCESGRFSSACTAALGRLDGANVPPSPSDSTVPPTGADCAQMIAELEQARDNRTAAVADPDAETRGNPFWRNLRGFAQQACGTTVQAASTMMGLCPIPDMTGPSGSITRAGVNTYSRSEDEEGFNRCVEASLAQIEANRRSRIEEVTAELGSAATESVGRTRLQQINEVFNRDVANARNGMTRRGTCSIQEDNAITNGTGESVNAEYPIRLLASLATKIRSNSNLSEAEENQLRAATGLTSRQFRNVFCQNHNHENFLQVLRQNLMTEATVIGTSPEANMYLGQARVARTKLSRCAASARALDGDDNPGCRLYAVNDFNSVRCATAQHPVLALNRSTNRCMLVTGFERRVTATEDVEEMGGTVGQRNAGSTATLQIRTPGRNSQMDIRSESYFQRDYQLQEYRCDGERSITAGASGGRCWMDQDVNRRTHPDTAPGTEEASEL